MKNGFIYILLGWVTFLSDAFAQEEPKTPAEKQEVEIPFIYEKREVYSYAPRQDETPLPKDRTTGSQFYKYQMEKDDQVAALGQSTYTGISEQIANFASSHLKNLVSVFKEDICSANAKGEFEITFKVDAGGKILGIGLAGEGGLKALVRCD